MESTRINPNDDLTQEKALSVLIQAVNLAQSKGVYSFEEAELLSKCVRKFTTPIPPAPVPTPQLVETPAVTTTLTANDEETVVL